MTNPTLRSNDTPFAGFTVTSLCERLVATRGMTLDAATGRTLVSSTESSEAYDRIRRAFTFLTARYPSVYTIQEYTVAWTSGDHSIVMPDNLRSVIAVLFGGVNIFPLKRDDYLRIVESDSNGGGVQLVSGGMPGFYRITGIADADATAAVDWRTVMRMYPTPAAPFATATLTVMYICKSPALATLTEELPVMDIMQEWLLCRARALWASDEGDDTTKRQAMVDLQDFERDLNDLLEGEVDMPAKVTWDYPLLPGHTRNE